MRGFFFFIIGLIVAACAICLAIFAAQNATSHNYTFLGAAFSLPAWVLMGAAALVGFLIGLLLVTPARVSADRGYNQLRAHAQRLERDLSDARATNTQLQSQLTTLQAEHGLAVHERDALKQRVEALQTAEREPRTASAPPAPPAERTATDERRITQRDTTTPAATAAEQPQPTERPGLGDRLRTLLGKPDTSTNRDETPGGPAVTA